MMKAHPAGYLSTLTLLMTAPFALGQTTESGWLERVKGHKGKVIGAEIRDIDNYAPEGHKIVTVAIPKTAVTDPDDIEEIIVIANKPMPREPILDLDYRWVRDYDRDYFGLIIHLDDQTQWPIRLFMSSGAETQPYNR